MGKLALHWKILIAMVLGVLWSLISGAYGLNGFTANWIDPFGTIFINILKFIAIPLVLFSITRLVPTCKIYIPYTLEFLKLIYPI